MKVGDSKPAEDPGELVASYGEKERQVGRRTTRQKLRPRGHRPESRALLIEHQPRGKVVNILEKINQGARGELANSK